MLKQTVLPLTPCLLILEFCLEYWSLVAKCTAIQIISRQKVNISSELKKKIKIVRNDKTIVALLVSGKLLNIPRNRQPE